MRLHWTLQPAWQPFWGLAWTLHVPCLGIGVIYGSGLGLHKLFHKCLEGPFYTTLGCKFGYRCL